MFFYALPTTFDDQSVVEFVEQVFLLPKTITGKAKH